jgi:hypothetical protein
VSDTASIDFRMAFPTCQFSWKLRSFSVNIRLLVGIFLLALNILFIFFNSSNSFLYWPGKMFQGEVTLWRLSSSADVFELHEIVVTSQSKQMDGQTHNTMVIG